MIWMSGAEKQITYLNQTWLDYTGQPLDAVLGQRRAHILHPDDAERSLDVYEKAFEQREVFQMEHRLRRHDGDYRWVVAAGVPRYDVDGSFAGYIGTAVDITERKLAEEALSTVSQKLIEAHEEESTRIARELHDDINQRPAMVSMSLDDLKQSPSASAADFERIGEVKQQIADLVSDIQALSHDLHPAKLEFMGLEAAAAGFCEELSNRHGMTIDVHFEDIPKVVPPEISLSLYRVLQEALQNVVKHSVSGHAHVSLSGQSDTLTMVIQDSGAGFDPHEAMRGPGLGLTSMKERLKVVGGSFPSTRSGGWARRFTLSRLSVSQRSLQTSFDDCCSKESVVATWRSIPSTVRRRSASPCERRRSCLKGWKPSAGQRMSLPLSPRQRSRQISEFGFHVFAIGQRLRDLLPEDVAIPLAEPVNGDLERALRCAHFSCECGIRRVGLIEQEDLQPVEMVQTPMLHELGTESVYDSVEH